MTEKEIDFIVYSVYKKEAKQVIYNFS